MKNSFEFFSISLLQGTLSNLKEREVTDTQTDPNASEQSARLATIQNTTTERMKKKQIQNTDLIGQGNRPDEDKSESVVGTSLRKHRPHSSPKPRRDNGPSKRIFGRTHRISHQR